MPQAPVDCYPETYGDGRGWRYADTVKDSYLLPGLGHRAAIGNGHLGVSELLITCFAVPFNLVVHPQLYGSGTRYPLRTGFRDGRSVTQQDRTEDR